MLWNSLIGLSRHTIKQENYFGNCFTVVDIGDNAIYMNNFYPGMTKKKKKIETNITCIWWFLMTNKSW